MADKLCQVVNFLQYSKGLNKLYIVWDKIIPVQFTWIQSERNLVVRALPVYTDAQDMKNPVLRCVLHSNRDEETNDGILLPCGFSFLLILVLKVFLTL